MSKMIIFEVETKVKKTTMKRIFVVNYALCDRRLFQVNLSEPELLAEDMMLQIGSLTSIKRHTDSGFIVKHFQPGDQVILTTQGDWKVKHSVEGYFAVFFRRLMLFQKDVLFWVKRKFQRNELGTIKRQIKQDFCFYIESR